MRPRSTVRRLAVFSGIALACVAWAAPMQALAQDAYPSKTIRFVVPYPPGGPTDLMARMLQTELQTRTRYVARLCMNAASELMAIRINP